MIPFNLMENPFQFWYRYPRGVAFFQENAPMTTSITPYPEVLTQSHTNRTDDYDHEGTPYSRSTSTSTTSTTPEIPTATPIGPNAKKQRPSVVPVQDFDAKKDAEQLVKALTSYGSNGELIIATITNRTLEQRKMISKEYKSFTGIQLIDDFKREVTGKLQTLLLALMISTPRLFAIELRRATKGFGTDEKALIEILTTLSTNEMKEVKKEYYKVFNRKLEDDVRGDTSGPFRKLLLLLIQAKRSESREINRVRAKHFAKMLYRAGELRFGVDKDTFIGIFCMESFTQLNEIFRQYELLTGNDIDEVVESEFTFYMEKALRAIVQITRNRHIYYAQCLYKAMKGIGTDDGALIRIMVSRSEIDLLDIADTFLKLYGDRLEAWIEDDSSDLYRECLLALLRPKLSKKIAKTP